MAEELLVRWEERIRIIASNLLALEVNTVIKNGMVGQKMPEVPVALHEIVQQYGEKTGACGAPVTQRLLVAACGRLSDPANSLGYLKFLRAWSHAPHIPPPWPIAGQAPPPDDRVESLTNGAESFEAIIWTAAAARELALREEQRADASLEVRLANQRQAAILSRIEENSRQLREAALVLEKGFSSSEAGAATAHRERVTDLQSSTETYAERLAAIMQDPDAALSQQSNRLFGGTVDQTTQALFRHPRPVIAIDPDLTVLIRKAWDIGLEEVRFQTTVQIDGDVLVRVAEMPHDDRDFLAGLHRNAVDDGLKQWRLLFQVVGDLIGDVGAWLFGGRGKATPAPPTRP